MKKAAPKKAAKKQAKAKPVSSVSDHPEVKATPEVNEAPIVHLSPVQQINARRILLTQELNKKAEKFAELLPKHITLVKFINAFVNFCLTNTVLLQCTPTSLMTCAIRSAQLGLVPDVNTGEAHLIPFVNQKKNNLLEAQFLPGYRGLIQLALRSGLVKRFQPRAVYQGDEFDYAYGTNEYIAHKPKGQSKQITFVYAVIEFVNGGIMFDVMSLPEIEEVRNDSPEWKNTPAKQKDKTFWVVRFADMAKKTVIRRLSKYAPISSEFQFAVSLDEKIEVIGESQIDTENINWEELSAAEQEKILQDLLQQDKEKKDLLLNSAISQRQDIKKSRSSNLMAETERLVTT